MSTFNHEQAFTHARDQGGWRMPNVKELNSLVDLSVSGSGDRIDPSAFPGSNTGLAWTSSPLATSSYIAWFVNISTGYLAITYRSHPDSSYAIRLVRINKGMGGSESDLDLEYLPR
jgi:hypothetical protein